MILVDSSVWVDYFRGVDSPATSMLDQLLGQFEVALADLVLMEVLQGYRDVREARAVETFLSRLRCFTLGGISMARAAASNYRQLRALGIAPRSSIDVLIATFCIEQNIDLLATDRDFTLMAPHLGLRILEPMTH